MNDDTLGKRIITARKAAGFSIIEASQKLGFKTHILSDIEKDVRKINAHEMVMIARLYGRNLDYFLSDDVPIDPVPLWTFRAKEKEVNDE
jgi:transcriptional regulator with XRE-family HTH domain